MKTLKEENVKILYIEYELDGDGGGGAYNYLSSNYESYSVKRIGPSETKGKGLMIAQVTGEK